MQKFNNFWQLSLFGTFCVHAIGSQSGLWLLWGLYWRASRNDCNHSDSFLQSCQSPARRWGSDVDRVSSCWAYWFFFFFVNTHFTSILLDVLKAKKLLYSCDHIKAFKYTNKSFENRQIRSVVSLQWIPSVDPKYWLKDFLFMWLGVCLDFQWQQLCWWKIMCLVYVFLRNM